MSYFKDTDNKVHWLDDDSYTYLLPVGSTLITEERAGELLAPTPEEVRAVFIATAQSALDKSDTVALRCFKAGVAFPPEWITYVGELRNIVRGIDISSNTLPLTPSYPQNT